MTKMAVAGTSVAAVISGGIGTTSTVGLFNVRIVAAVGKRSGAHNARDMPVYGA